MTYRAKNIAERALMRRISDSRSEVHELINEAVKAGDPSDAVLDVLDQRILDSGVRAPSIMVLPYLQKHMRPKLFAALCGTGSLTDGDLAQLFKIGYGDDATEHKLCDWLYRMYDRDGYPWRVVVVEALSERGGREGLEVLEVIRFEIDPKLRATRIVASSIQRTDEVEVDQYLRVVTGRALMEFTALVDSALETLRTRVDRASTASTVPNLQRGAQSTPTAVSVSTGAKHARSAKVEQYRANAESRLADHPDAALTSIRMAAEAICKDLLGETVSRAKGDGGKKRVTLEDMRAELRQRKVEVPADADKYLSSIQSFGNLGSHDQEIDLARIDSRMARSTLAHLDALIEWYRSFDPLLPLAPDAGQQ